MLAVVAVAALLFAIVTVAWTTVKVGISPMPSSGKARKEILRATENSGEGPIIDMGSGWGTLAIPLARKYPEREILGYELSPVPWLVSQVLKYAFNLKNLSLYQQDFLKADLAGAAVLVCYLYPAGMAALQKKLRREVRREIRIVSNTFALPNSPPAKVIRLGDLYKTPIYIYQYRLPS